MNVSRMFGVQKILLLSKLPVRLHLVGVKGGLGLGNVGLIYSEDFMGGIQCFI
jgi:hypothetical protein